MVRMTVFVLALVMAAPMVSGASNGWGPVRRGMAREDPGPGARKLGFANGLSFDPLAGVPAPPAGLAGTMPAPGDHGIFLVQGRPPLSADFRQLLRDHGAEPLRYHPASAYVVRATPEVISELRLLPEVRWAGLYHVAYRLSPSLDVTSGARQEVLVTLLDGAGVNAVTSQLTALGATIDDVSVNEWNRLIVAGIDGSQLPRAAAIPGVDFIEPRIAMRPDNDLGQWVIQTGTSGNRRIWDLGITGTGQVITLHDTGIHMSHCMFRDPAVPVPGNGDYPTHRKVIAYKSLFGGIFGDPEAALGGHGTHTSCTAAGDDNGPDTHDGMAPGAKIYFTDGGSPAGGIWLPPDLNTLFAHGYAGNPGGVARISSNSWGGGTAGTYPNSSKQVDQFMWNHPDFLICFSVGNNGPAGGSMHPPSTAKNCIACAATGNGLDSMSVMDRSSSRGPMLDGRMGPTLCAPGLLSSANHNTTCGMQTLSGSSMATAAIAGSCALIRQYLNEGWYPSGTRHAPDAIAAPSAALLKAMAVNSGSFDVQPGAAPCDTTGWGRMLLDDVLYFAGDSRRLLLHDEWPGLVTTAYDEYTVYVYDATQPLEVTLVWTDYPGSSVAAVQLTNDLNLTVTDGIATYFGNEYMGGESVTGGSADDLNTVECVQRNAPTPGPWTIRVKAVNAPFGPQPYALVVTGGVGVTTASVPGGHPASGMPGELTLSHGPNPVVSRTVFTCSLPCESTVDLTIYDVSGRVVRNLVRRMEEARDFRIGWDTRDGNGHPVPSGMYFARLITRAGERVDKLVVTR